MERIGDRFYIVGPNGSLREIKSEMRGYLRVPSMPEGITFIENHKDEQQKDATCERRIEIADSAESRR